MLCLIPLPISTPKENDVDELAAGAICEKLQEQKYWRHEKQHKTPSLDVSMELISKLWYFKKEHIET